ncbi:MAG TPA: shikimate kinase, partial [Marmoricola sp.]|nr:shikimate kinase [Marmoricola sp.]
RVLFLKVGISDAAARVGLGVSRPMLLGNVRGRVRQLIEERTPIYESVATMVLDTSGLDPDQVVELALQMVKGGDHE